MTDLRRPVKRFDGRRTGTGFSLIELLVAVLVMGIGVLGVTALQMVSLQNNRMALERGEAVSLAYDMMDRIKANPSAAYDGIAIGDVPPAAPGCLGDGANCSAAQMATFDESAWKCQLGEFRDDAECDALRAAGVIPAIAEQPGLPDGDGAVQVQVVVLPNGVQVFQARVTVQWSATDGQLQTVVIDSQA
ncbi:MAG: type IV pilus modification protein PilV [Pseudomonadales bacterium]